jgi:hypothetical protein
MTIQNVKLKNAYTLPLIFDFYILIFYLLLPCHFAFSLFPFDFLLVFNAFPAFYSLTIGMLHFSHLADQVCFFYNLFCGAPTG